MSGTGELRMPSRDRAGAWREWVFPVAFACAGSGVLALAAAAVRLPAAPGGMERARSTPELVVTRIDRLPRGDELRERFRLLDPTPLFMPEERVGGALLAAEGLEERPSGEAGASFPAALAFPEQGPAREILRPTPPRTPLAAAEIVAAPNWFAGMARTDGRPEADPAPRVTGGRPDTGRVEVYRVGEGGRVASAGLPVDPILEEENWAPMELTVLVNAAGAVAAPAVISGSGVGEVDERVRALLIGEVLPRLRLRPGTYRVVAGP